MKRTAEELVALREAREKTDRENDRAERRRQANRLKRRKLGDGDLVKQLGLSSAELRGLVLDAKDPATRKRWSRLGLGRRVSIGTDSGDPEEPVPEAAE